MKPVLISEQNLRLWLESVRASGRRLFAPQRVGGKVLYREVADAGQIGFDTGKAAYSLKALLFPVTEQVLRFRLGNGGINIEEIEPPTDGADVVVFGVTPCDAAALRVLDRVFLESTPDPFYARRRKRLTVIGLCCRRAEPECFCAAVGLSPVGCAGSDVLVTPLEATGDGGNGEAARYLLEAITGAGETLLAQLRGQWEQPADAAEAEGWRRLKSELEQRVRSQMRVKEPFGDAAAQLQADFESPVWEEAARKCLGCGVCAFSCPTCHCFDLVDEGDLRCGVRCKNWDSCCFAMFTLHASGQNPRPTQAARYRQRVLHKFGYFPQRTGLQMCVGCGRCTKYCPVGLDICEVRRRWR